LGTVQTDYVNVSVVESSPEVSPLTATRKVVEQIALGRLTVGHDVHHESRHACTGGTCLVESNYSNEVERSRAMTSFHARRSAY
jgi:hypothetical protein